MSFSSGPFSPSVSKSTVSLVLQNSPLVRAETRADVRQAMADLGYVYNRSAAQLRQSNTGLIGLVINDLRNPFFTEFATSVQMALSDAGFAAVLANTDEDPKLQQRAIAGMVAAPVSSVYPNMGSQVLIMCFVVVVIGGIGSIKGALLAALLIGLVDTFGKVLLPQVSGMLVYVLMAVVLLYKPVGLFKN